MEDVKDIVGGIGVMFMRVSDGSCDRIASKYLNLGIDLADVRAVINTLFFKAVKIALGIGSEGKKSGYLAVFPCSCCEVLQGFAMLRIDLFFVPFKASWVVGNRTSVSGMYDNAIGIAMQA